MKEKVTISLDGVVDIRNCFHASAAICRMNPEMELCESLSRLLRHGGSKVGLPISSDGFVRIKLQFTAVDIFSDRLKTSTRIMVESFKATCRACLGEIEEAIQEVKRALQREMELQQTVMNPEMELCESLSRLLRHGGSKVGLPISSDGFVRISDILRLRGFAKWNFEDVFCVAEQDKMTKFCMIEKNAGVFEIRSHQNARDVQQFPENLDFLSLLTKKKDIIPDEELFGTYEEAANSGRKWVLDPSFRMEKSLAWILREGDPEFGIQIPSGDGFMEVDDILSHREFSRWRLEDIKVIVEKDKIRRFHLRKNRAGAYEIRANHGHKFPLENLKLSPMLSKKGIPGEFVYGTSKFKWKTIKSEGIRPLENRNHIFLWLVGLKAENPEIEKEEIIRIKPYWEIMIYVDIEAALKSGTRFFKSPNGLCMSPDTIKPDFFAKVLNLDRNEVQRPELEDEELPPPPLDEEPPFFASVGVSPIAKTAKTTWNW
ncbi:unnamed protein product [Notodromas monacha]|uniref:2'-phosphotransferase n=1 Tax=Notodromas monacha TaxID=399045 RepID=A0A7R9BPH3_9CRUS|nr:unnamed protein product [Notodromas monacha]CAG0919257.1 unnamed protein product [Notodromas monacha]